MSVTGLLGYQSKQTLWDVSSWTSQVPMTLYSRPNAMILGILVDRYPEGPSTPL